jgi:hypothetical protein
MYSGSGAEGSFRYSTEWGWMYRGSEIADEQL